MDTAEVDFDKMIQDLMEEIKVVANDQIKNGNTDMKMRATYTIMAMEMANQAAGMLEQLEQFRLLILKAKNAPVSHESFVRIRNSIQDVIGAIIASVDD